MLNFELSWWEKILLWLWYIGLPIAIIFGLGFGLGAWIF